MSAAPPVDRTKPLCDGYSVFRQFRLPCTRAKGHEYACATDLRLWDSPHPGKETTP